MCARVLVGLWQALGVCFGLSLMSTPLQAQSSVEPRSSVAFSREQFFSEAVDPAVDSTFSQLRWNYTRTWENLLASGDFGLESLGQLALDGSGENHLALPELYLLWSSLSLGPMGEWDLSLGRKRHLWSAMDQEWKIGLWQPLVRWDEIHRLEQGLTGVFLSSQTPQIETTLFVSPLFLPDQGAQIALEEGRFLSGSRWFTSPPQSMIPAGEDRTEIFYELDRPSAWQVIQQTSLAGQLKIGSAKGPWLAVTGTDKPLNQLQLPFEAFLDISLASDSGLGRVRVYPQVARHRLVSLEGGYRQEEAQVWVSLTRESVRPLNWPEEWESLPLNSGYFASVGYRQDWSALGLRGLSSGVSYLGHFEDTPLTAGDFSSSGGEASSPLGESQRYPFRQALAWDLASTWSWAQDQSLSLGFRHTYSFSERGSLVSLQSRAQASAQLHWSLALDVLGAPNRQEAGGLIQRYGHNDRIRAEVIYVF